MNTVNSISARLSTENSTVCCGNKKSKSLRKLNKEGTSGAIRQLTRHFMAGETFFMYLEVAVGHIYIDIVKGPQALAV